MLNKLHIIFLFIVLLSANIVASPKNDKEKNKTTAETDGIKFNRITLPIYEAGQIGNQIKNPTRKAGIIDTMSFLYSSGFFLSGYDQNYKLWSNGVEITRKILDYVKGTVENPDDSLGVYTNSVNSIPFGSEWQNWKNAVKLGAEFYDGDKDGVYLPIDKNGNGIWDENEDRPAQYGDVMAWSAFNDGVPTNERRIEGTEPLGINIRQTVWGYSNNPNLEKVVFIKYSIENTGKVSPILYDVNFSLATDTDLGYYRNDFLASDETNNMILAYSPYRDFANKENQIALTTTMMQGPISNSNLSQTAYILEGENLNQQKINSKKNANIVATVNTKEAYFPTQIYQPFSTDLIRKVMLGENNPEPCNSFDGIVNNIDCNNINKAFIYSGNIIMQKGWINTRGSDKAFLITSGTFNLEEKKPIDIIFAFVLGVNEEPTEAMKEAITNGREIKYNFFDKPQSYPEVNPTTITNDNSIEILFDTSPQRGFSNIGYGYNIDFQGYNIYMFNSSSTSETINNQPNKKLIATYKYSSIKNLLIEDENDLTISTIIADETPVVELSENKNLHKITWDPFNNESLRKGKPYYFSITPFGFDNSKMVKYGIDRSYLIPGNVIFGYLENEPVILNDDKGNLGIVIGENQNDSYFKGVLVEHKEGISEAKISYSIYEQESVKDDLYEVGFQRLPWEETYSLKAILTNVSSGKELNRIFLQNDYLGNVNDMRDGFVLDIDWIEPGRVKTEFSGTEKWFTEFDDRNTGVFYVGSDIKESQKVFAISLKQSMAISIEDLSTVELRFGDSSKALRYVRTLVRYPWKGTDNVDSGFVKIPVSAYAIDKFGNETKMQLGFLENGFALDTLKFPDGKWNPSTSITATKEYLIVFNTPYSEDISQLVAQTGTSSRVADVANGYLLNASGPNITDSIKAIARSPWFNAMYIAGFTTPFHQIDFNPTGKLTITPSHVLTENDKYYFRVKTEKSKDEKKAQFDKINVYPNPLFAYNPLSNSFGFANDEPFVTFSNLPEKVNIKIYSLSGVLIKLLDKNDLSASLRWNLKNEYGNKIASGLYIAIINVPDLGQKILKFSIIQAQKQVHY